MHSSIDTVGTSTIQMPSNLYVSKLDTTPRASSMEQRGFVKQQRASIRNRHDLFKQGRNLIGEREETILDRNSIFHAIFDGKKPKPKQMFSTIKYYTPSMYPRVVPHITNQVQQYNDAVRKRQSKENAYARLKL
mmetsp:Transcript_33395/g.41244  ORF Transcript_33395/g.41244 Transcript_33395/m.41244 type:complete len:134 (-) Transcript_33395:1422-1823(-)